MTRQKKLLMWTVRAVSLLQMIGTALGEESTSYRYQVVCLTVLACGIALAVVMSVRRHGRWLTAGQDIST